MDKGKPTPAEKARTPNTGENAPAAGSAGKKDKKDRRKLLIILLLLLITLIAVGITIWAVFFRDTKTTLTPDYAPQETEEYAEPIGDDDDEKLEVSEGGGAVSLSYSTEVTIDLSEETASLYFANPSKSTQDMVLQLVIQDTVVIQSGLLTPGNQVSTLSLLDGAADILEEGGYDGEFIVLYYDPDSGEKAVVNTEIPVTITVTG
ncbi:MAG: hypothetical protein LUG99_09525 [Lachnospiraceae bacterium]|nr:hypothetical protein [Lachnospiraceae bacterium]